MTKNILQGPFIKSHVNSKKIMINIIITLLALTIFTIVTNGLITYLRNEVNIIEILSNILNPFIIIITIILTKIIYQVIRPNKNNLSQTIKDPNNIILSLILNILIPITTPIYLIILASIITSLVSSLYQTFKYHLINPLILGLIPIIITSLPPQINNSHIEFINIISLIIYLIIFMYLCYKQAIKWQITISYLITFILSITFITITNQLPITYPINYLITYNLIFSAIFVAPSSYTSPTTKYGRIIYGISLGIINLILYYLTPYINNQYSPLIAILIMNLFVKPIDQLSIQINFNKPCQKSSLAIIIIIAIIITSIISYLL